MAWTLCKKEDITAIYPVQVSVLQDLWSDAVEEMIREYTSSPYLGASVIVSNELHNGDGATVLIVRKLPILEVHMLTIDGVLLSVDQYRIIANGVQLLNGEFVKGQMNVSVSYTSGSVSDTDAVPYISPIVRMTAVAMIIAIVNYRGRLGSDGSLKWADADTREGEPSPNANIGLTSHITKIMRRMLRREKVRVL